MHVHGCSLPKTSAWAAAKSPLVQYRQYEVYCFVMCCHVLCVLFFHSTVCCAVCHVLAGSQSRFLGLCNYQQ